MRNAPKTPYEIRLELLQLSFEILSSQHAAKAVNETGEIKSKTAPTTEDVVAEAEKMNVFISKAS